MSWIREPNADPIPEHQTLDVSVFLNTVVGDSSSRFWRQSEQLSNGSAAAASRSKLQPLPEQHQSDDDGGNFVCVDLSSKKSGVVVFWMGAAPENNAPSLDAWLGDIVNALEAGQYQEDLERGTLNRE